MITRKSYKYNAPVRKNAAGAFAVILKDMRKTFMVLITISAVVLSMLAGTSSAFADDSYTTDVFDVNIDITKKHVIKYEERITVDFLSPHHGIYRYIPVQKKFYDVDDIHIYGGDYEESYKSSGENENGTYGNTVLQIGDAYQTFTGQKDYRIIYSLVCTKDEDSKKDYLSLDLLPTGWQTAIKSADVVMTLPNKVNWDDVHNAYMVKNMMNREITIVNLTALVISGSVAILMAIMWLANGRDPDVIKPVEFYPPDDLTPAEIGYIVDGSLDNKDVSSMLLYFASKGYLDVREKSKGSKEYQLVKKKDIPDSEPVFAVRLFGGLFPYESAVEGQEQVTDLDDLPSGFADSVKVAKDQLKSTYDYGSRRMFTLGSKSARNSGKVICALILPAAILIAGYARYMAFSLLGALIPFIFASIGIGFISSSYDNRHSSGRVQSVARFIVGVVLCGIAMAATLGMILSMGASPLIALVAGAAFAVSVFFEVFMWARTKQNAVIYGKILGFRNFIETAEYDRLKALSEENPEYYYQIMPYAMVMGMSVKWAKKFENLKVPEPEWYEGTAGADIYDVMWYSHMMDSCAHQFVTIPDVSEAVDSGGFFTGGDFSGGGFGGGGFSGGGFGGGGGGAW